MQNANGGVLLRFEKLDCAVATAGREQALIRRIFQGIDTLSFRF